MKEIIIESFIEAGDKNVPMDSLPKEKAVHVSTMLQDIFMGELGYRREKNPG